MDTTVVYGINVQNNVNEKKWEYTVLLSDIYNVFVSVFSYNCSITEEHKQKTRLMNNYYENKKLYIFSFNIQ